MAMIELEVRNHVALVTLNDGENRHNPTSLAAFMEVLDRVEAETDCRVLVVTSGLIPFLVVSIVLSVALIGAIILAREKLEAEELN